MVMMSCCSLYGGGAAEGNGAHTRKHSDPGSDAKVHTEKKEGLPVVSHSASGFGG